MTTAVKFISYYCGKRVDQMTRDELIEAVETLGRLYDQSLRRSLDLYAPSHARRYVASGP